MASLRASATSRARRSTKRAAPRKVRPKVYGCETPRIYTPPLRKLTPQTSLGFAVIEFARELLGMELLPWQKWLLIHMLELLPDNTPRFRNVVVLVARQNGKSTLSQVLALWFMYVYGFKLVLGTAQDLDTAEEVWEGAVNLVTETDDETDEYVRPELAALVDKVVQVNGKKSLNLTTKKRYKVKAANRRAGRGLSGDFILLDELREHQTWDAWGAITKTTMARAIAIVLALSNAGDATSVVLRYLRKLAHAELGDPDGINAADDPESLLPDEEDLDDPDLDLEDLEIDDDSLGFFEWSAPPGCDINDRAGWAQANPSLGYTITERTIASAARTDPEWIFRTEVLCQWSDGTLEGPFPPGSWDDSRVKAKTEDEIPQIVGKVKAGIALSRDRTMCSIAFAGTNDRGRPQIELVARRAGIDWVKAWLQEDKRVDLIEEITGQGKGAPESQLLEDLLLAGMPVTKWEGSALAEGTGRFYDAVRDGEFDHLPQPPLDIAAATAVPKMLGAGAFLWDDAKSTTDIAPLRAANGAHWLLTRPTEKPAESAYEARGVLTI
ncbi:hypothetical protein [Terrabacter terrigena]|uniref:Terminase n=1 Tax=Terrabacter terrigena TaxID=574718 RepID=A0ABW3N034_9MICO